MPSAFAPSTLQIAPGMQRPPENTRLGPGLALALVAHLLLVLALSLNVQWHTQTPDAAAAELWAAVPQVAAPHAEEPLAEPTPPQPTPEQVQAQQQQQQALQAQQDAEIAIAKTKKLEAQKEADRLAALQKEQQRKLDEQKAQEAKELKDKQAKLEQAKLDQQKAKELKDQDAKKDKASDAKLEAMRRDYLKRIQGMAGATGSPTATGNALHNAAPSAAYGGRVVGRVRPNIIFNDQTPDNPQAEVDIRVAPDGTIISSNLHKSSGNPDWDRAVLRAIEKTAILPRDTDGSVPPEMLLVFKRYD